MAARVPSEADLSAWAAYVRHVTALPGRATPALTPPPPPKPAGTAPAPSAAAPPRRAPPAELAIGTQPAGVDARTFRRLRTLHAERTLDLHGRTAQHAFDALAAFLHRAQTDRLRVVEVITGRGQGESGGVIRRELPFWLNLPRLRPMVLAAVHPHAANVGSVRILLRRAR